MSRQVRLAFFVLGLLFACAFVWEWNHERPLTWFWLGFVGALLSWTCACTWDAPRLAAAREDPHERCPICLDTLLGDVVALPCLHVFHRGCILRWFEEKMTCPTCIRRVPPRQVWDCL